MAEMSTSAPQPTPLRLALRLLWLGVRLTLVIWFAQQGSYFMYQGF